MDNENFKKLHGFFIEDLKKGQNAEIKRKILAKAATYEKQKKKKNFKPYKGKVAEDQFLKLYRYGKI